MRKEKHVDAPIFPQFRVRVRELCETVGYEYDEEIDFFPLLHIFANSHLR